MLQALSSMVTLSLVLAATACAEKSPSADTTGGSGGLDGLGGGAGSSAGSTAFSCTSSGGATGTLLPVAAGEFVMGCNASVDADCREDEKPLHTVSMSAFEIDETEVTQNQYAACIDAGNCTAPSCEWNCDAVDNPAACVTWDQAKLFCAWASKRLPTEAEWEKAARGTDGRKYPWGNEEPTCARANMSGCGEQASAVGAHPDGKSPYGALDMAGNVVEMVADWYDAAYYQSSANIDPQGPADGKRYVGRGGGYKSLPLWQRASSRDWYDLEDFGQPMGFRCAR